MSSRVLVAGVGMGPFTTWSNVEGHSRAPEHAVREALADAAMSYDQVQQAFAGYVYDDTGAGQAALYRLGQTGIPIVNVNNSCATGATVLWMARQAILTEAADCVIAVGFEHLRPRTQPSQFSGESATLHQLIAAAERLQDWDHSRPAAPQFFGRAGRQYAERYNARVETFASVAVKARLHAKLNPHAMFRDPVTVDQVMASDQVWGPLTRMQCCVPAFGATAVVLVGERFARTHDVSTSVSIKAQVLRSDSRSTFVAGDMLALVGYDTTRAAAHEVYESSGVTPEDLQVVELHDNFTTNELISYESLGLTPEGTAEKFIADGDNTYGGRVVTNPSGGLLSRGHPAGATGLAQCAELTWQLRGQAGSRQVDGARLALQHSIGLGGATVVTLYERSG